MTEDYGRFAEIHDELRTVAREQLGKAERDTALDWSLVARSGWLGLEAPDEFDGAEATFAEVAVLLREMGRAAAHGPYVAVAALGLGALALTAPNAARDELFRATVAGAAVPIPVLSGASMDPAPAFRCTGESDGLYLRGSADFVLDAPAADRLLVPATLPDGSLALAAIDPGTTVVEQPVLDGTRRFGTVTIEGLRVPQDSIWPLRDAGALRRLYDRAAITTACDSLGLGAAMLDATVEYVGVRTQFDRPVGSFQAVKHACADMLVHLRVAEQLVEAAVRAHVTGAPNAAAAASMAKAYATAGAVDVVGKAMQLHGGIGYTWESDVHVHLKRVALNRSLYGAPAEHRRRLAERFRSRAAPSSAAAPG